MLQRGLRGALRSVPSASTARVGGLRVQSSISYVPRNLGRPALRLRACGAAVPPRASVRHASTLVAKPEHPEDETVMEGDTPLVHLTERAVEVRPLSNAENSLGCGSRQRPECGTAHHCRARRMPRIYVQARDHERNRRRRLVRATTNPVSLMMVAHGSSWTASRSAWSKAARSTMSPSSLEASSPSRTIRRQRAAAVAAA